MRRVRLRVHGFQALDGDVGVDLGRRELGVAEHRLEVTDVTAGVVHERRHRKPSWATPPACPSA